MFSYVLRCKVLLAFGRGTSRDRNHATRIPSTREDDAAGAVILACLPVYGPLLYLDETAGDGPGTFAGASLGAAAGALRAGWSRCFECALDK